MPDAASEVEVKVRAAEPGDLPKLAEMFDAYRVFYGQESKPAESEAYLKRRLEKQDAALFVAEVDGEAVGFSQLYPTLSSVAMRRVWTLNDLYVDEAHRQSGVAAALLKAADDHARETGASRLELSTARDNRAAQALYEKHGWIRDDVFVHYVRGVE